MLKKYLQKGDICVPQVHSDMLNVDATSVSFPIHREGIYDKLSTEDIDDRKYVTKGIRLQIQKTNGELQDIFEKENSRIEFQGDSSKDSIAFLKLQNLEPGKLYKLTMKYHESYLSVRFVTICTCSGSDANVDKTGAPKHFQILRQEHGKIFFQFVSNSMCKSAFSFIRYPEYEEFETNLSPTTFSTMSWAADSSCNGEVISPEGEVYDNMNLSKLIVGRRYVYCVRATASSGLYMPNPYDTSESSINLSYSDASCAPYEIHWEASISGVVTTEPDAGSLPIENVTVGYQLLSTTFEDLSCNGCSGSIATSSGGGFDIEFNVLHPYLKGLTHLNEIPVRLFFTKTTSGKETISHRFLCNFGEKDCTDSGLIVYLKHLEFKKMVEVYDATSVMFAGKVFIQNTDGCPVNGALVEIFHLMPDGRAKLLVDTETDGNGLYEGKLDYHIHVTSHILV